MSDHEAAPSPGFDPDAIARALGARPATIRDVAYGEGQQFSAGRGTVRLEVYPRTEVTRVTIQDARIELFGTAGATVSGSGVVFSRVQPREEASLAVLPDGVVFTFIGGGQRLPETSQEPQAAPPTPPSVQGSATPLPDPEAPAGGDLAAPRPDATAEHSAHAAPGATGQAATPVTQAETRERGTLVKFTGRLGKDPFVTDKHGSPRVRLSVGEHYEDDDGAEQTRWHEVWATNANSEAVRRLTAFGALRQGVEVRVRGYRHERGPDNQGRPQRPFIRAFQLDLTRKAAPRRGAQRPAPDTTGGGER